MNEIGLAGVRGVVFDAVGTLMDPEPSVARAYAQAARRQGVELDEGVVRGRFRRHFGDDEVDEMRGPLATDEATERRRWWRIVVGCLPEVPDPGRAFEELWDHFGRPSAWRPYPDAAGALGALWRAGLGVVVASNFDGRLRGVLAGLEGLRPWADSAVISSEVGRRKPHAEFYRAACARLGLPPGAVLCAGDDPENDLRGPRRAGLRAVLIDREGRAPGGLPALPSLGALADRLLAAPGRP
jgi:putative hydrolase of the HAD superfamily